MEYLGHVETTVVSYTARENEESLNKIKNLAKEHAEKLIKLVKEN